MTDKQAIEAVYKKMYEAMVAKDTATLLQLHAPEFILTHMTGMQQSREQYIEAIANGTLNYFNVQHEVLSIEIDGRHATLQGHSRVEAAVFGGGRHTWPLKLFFTLEKHDGNWRFISSKASVY
ncbi:MAG: nuclear transport factor 2 family protein [Bacteroidaceae bacterium]|nr:nuclear transport factor 2 family protein [Bacteroidaceae bacterium]